jgi:uncharacterized protein YaiI (UPF0178 family)
MTDLYVDADGCPVKEETYRVAQRYGLRVVLVCNRPLNVPRGVQAELVVVGRGSDEADKWIAAHAGAGDIVITADLPLAARCIDGGARVVTPRGRVFDAETIGDALATRDLMTTLREVGEAGGGPPPMSKADRSQFLQRLDELIHAVRRG